MTTVEKLRRTARNTLARKPENIVRLLITAHIEIPLELALNDATHKRNLSMFQLIHYTLFFCLSDCDLRRTFINFMPESFVSSFAGLSYEEPTPPLVCRHMTEEIMQFQHITTIVQGLLTELSSAHPHLTRQLISNFHISRERD